MPALHPNPAVRRGSRRGCTRARRAPLPGDLTPQNVFFPVPCCSCLENSATCEPLHRMKTLQLWIGVALSAALSCGSIRDERAQIHVLKVGDFMGENSGVITSIDEGA